MAKDIIGRPIEIDDFVFHYNYIYKVLRVSETSATIIIHPKSPTSNKKTIMSRECCLLPKDDVLMRILKNGEL